MRAFVGLVWCVIGLVSCAGAQAEERILDFRDDVVVAADGVMTVTETIRVRSEGRDIRRGIYRDFPTDYRDRDGRAVRVTFEPFEVFRDGAVEHWRAERVANGVRTWFGNPDVLLPAGEHEYVFRYRTARQLGFFADHDELYWNVTGNGWMFPIDKVSAVVTLPASATGGARTIEGYTGAQGSRGRDYEAAIDEAGRARIATSRTLAPGEGLTLVFAFPKGIVAPPDWKQRLGWFGSNTRREAVLAIGLLLLAAFMGVQWLRVGRDPEAGPIIAQYAPPPGLTPAAARFVQMRQYDDRCVAADAVELATRGVWRIRQLAAGTYAVDRVGELDRRDAGSLAELDDGLLGTAQTLTLDNSNHRVISAARSNHFKYLRENYASANFSGHGGIGCLGGLLLLAAVAAALFLSPLTVTAKEIVPTVATLLLVAIATGSAGHFLTRHRAGYTARGHLIAVIVCAAAAVPAAWFVAQATTPAFALMLAAIAIVYVTMAHLMAARTPEGRKLVDRIMGLRLYLSVAERDALQRAREPAMTVDQYQRLLPYAIALEAEQTWGDKLAAAIGPAAAAAAMASVSWYDSRHAAGTTPAGFADALGSSFASAISSSATAPGSSSGGSSGGGGGGSSGGGGGGGGGGGW